MLENDLFESAATTRRDGVIVSDGTPTTAGQMEQSTSSTPSRKSYVRRWIGNSPPKGCLADSCPYMASSFRRYRSSTPDHVEKIARRYAGVETAGASELIAAIAARATRAARAWAEGQRLDEISAEFGLAAGASVEAVAGFEGIDRNTPRVGRPRIWARNRQIASKRVPRSDGGSIRDLVRVRSPSRREHRAASGQPRRVPGTYRRRACGNEPLAAPARCCRTVGHARPRVGARRPVPGGCLGLAAIAWRFASRCRAWRERRRCPGRCRATRR